MKIGKIMVLKVLLLVVMLVSVSCGMPSDPMFDDMYTRNIYPGTGSTYDIGSATSTYANGYFDNLFAGGAPVGGAGDVVGPAGATDEAIARYDGATGKLIQDSLVFINDAGNLTLAGTVDGRDISVDGTKLDGIEALADVTDAANVDAAGAVMEADFNAKGDILTASADDTPLILTVGVDGRVLAADSGVAQGITWIPPPATISQANRSIYVDKEATGAGDGTSWADAFTTIQAGVDDSESVVVHAHTIYVRDGTKKLGTCDANVLNKLHDTGEFPVTTTWVGRRVFNIGGTGPGDNWGVVSARDSDDQLSIVTIAGVALDLFPNGNEDYVIEATPYRENVQLNNTPASYPSHLVLGSVDILAEYHWHEACDAQANAGEIKDLSADFSNVELGDRVLIIDLNGANGRCQDYEVGTVDDVSQIASHIVRTTLTKTPTTNWRYAISKCEVSGSDDGLESGTARDHGFDLNTVDKVIIHGFIISFTDHGIISWNNSRQCYAECIFPLSCDYGFMVLNQSYVIIIDSYDDSALALYIERFAFCQAKWCVFNAAGQIVIYPLERSTADVRWCYIDNATTAFYAFRLSYGYISRCTISANATTGLKASGNSHIQSYQTTNSATTPVDPVGTTEGSYIN